MGASMKQIKTRIKSVESTRQITKAMELVATSKLRKAKLRAENARPYHKVLLEAISAIQSGAAECPTVFAQSREVKKTCYVVIAGDRGLAGGYNANLFRMVARMSEGQEACILPIGKKATEHFRRRGSEILSSSFEVTGALGMGDCRQIGQLLCEGFARGDFDRVEIVYTEFCSMLSQVPASLTLLPITLEQGDTKRYSGAMIEGDPEELVARIVPLYVSGILYTTLCEAAASEHGARRTAMNSANKNAEEIIDTLVLKYNRARQAAITLEITEIVSGAEAL